MNKFINFPCIVEGVSSRKDRTLKITLGSQEMSPDNSAVLLSLANQAGHCYLSPNALQESDLVMPENEDLPQEKTPSKRLRSVLFVLWKQRGEQGDFRTFYEQNLERFIEAVKEKLT